MPHSFRGTQWLYQRLACSVKSHRSRNDQEKAESWNFFSAKPDGIAAVSRARMTETNNFGLPPQSARTLDALLCERIKS
jgi:hypothetical protein